MDIRSQITELIVELREGEAAAWDRLLPLVYEELQQIARHQLRSQHSGHTLTPTALVHEAYLKLVDRTRVPYADRAHFFAIAACAMRQILIDHARRQRTAKRGGKLRLVPMHDAEIAIEERAEVLLALDEALTRLATFDERLSRVVECRFFGGLTEEETAAALGITARTVRRDWLKAKLWLYGEIYEEA